MPNEYLLLHLILNYKIMGKEMHNFGKNVSDSHLLCCANYRALV